MSIIVGGQEITLGGWRQDIEDRGKLIQLAKPMLMAAAPTDLPEEMGVREWMQIEFQARQGACAGHARTSCLELGIKHQTGEEVQLCRQFAYITAQMLDGIVGDQGSTIISNALAAEKWGTPLEKWWPYSGRYDRNIPQEAWDHASEYTLNTHVICRSYDDVFNFLALGLGGVQIGVSWTNSFEAPIVETYSTWGSIGGHSVAFLDWSPKRDSRGRRYLRLFNSWGKEWGDDGTKLVSPDAIDQMLRDGNTVMIGLSDLKNLVPRRVSFTGKGSVF